MQADKGGPGRRTKINGLTRAQEHFAQEYMQGASQREAYHIAYPRSRNWKPASVDKKASDLMAKPVVRARVAELQQMVAAEVTKLTAVSVARTLEEQARVAFFDPRSLLDANGAPLPLHRWPAHAAAAVAGIEFTYLPVSRDDIGEDGAPVPGSVVAYPSKIRFVPKMTALDQIARHLGMYREDNAQRNQVNPWDRLPAESRTAIMERLREIVGRDKPGLAGSLEPSGGERTTH